MIRFYAYYNHGGYKDFYVGNHDDRVKSRFFLPLLVVHEAALSENPDDEELRDLVEHQKLLPKLVALSDATPEYNYPQEARILMSHGGYRILYKRLNHKYCALSIRDIVGAKDVYGRWSPFNMMFIGESEDLERMDLLAEYVRKNISSFADLLSSLFVNDLKENGLRCDVEKLTSAIRSIIEKKEPLSFCEDSVLPVRMIVVSSLSSLKMALKEQNLNRRDIDVCFDENGNMLFKADVELPNVSNDIQNSTLGKENCGQQTVTIEKRQIFPLHRLTNTPKLEDIENIWDYIKRLEITNIQMSKRIDELEKRITELENNKYQ